YSLNKGVLIAQGKYIARMDADDISLPKRFEKQVDFLEGNQGFDICGSAVETFGEMNSFWQVHKKHDEIKSAMLFSCSIFHPTIMCRAAVLKENTYDGGFESCEDYELWIRLLKEGYQFYNLQEALVKYRVHDKNIGTTSSAKQTVNSYRL